MQRETIARYLEEGYQGRKNAISSCALEKALGLSGNELRKKINRLRCDSIPISACRGGYFLCGDCCGGLRYYPQS